MNQLPEKSNVSGKAEKEVRTLTNPLPSRKDENLPPTHPPEEFPLRDQPGIHCIPRHKATMVMAERNPTRNRD